MRKVDRRLLASSCPRTLAIMLGAAAHRAPTYSLRSESLSGPPSKVSWSNVGESSELCLAVAISFSQGGNWSRWSERKLLTVGPVSGLCCSASQSPSTTRKKEDDVGIWPREWRRERGRSTPWMKASEGSLWQEGRATRAHAVGLV